MFNRLEGFWHGRVFIIAQGAQLARFINEALQDRVVFLSTQKSERCLRAQVSLEDFRRLRRAARATHTRIRIVAKYGWPFLAVRWRRRKGLIVGVLVICLVIAGLSQMVLSVKVTGNKAIPREEILASAEKLGLKTWVWRRGLDLNRIAKTIQEEFPNAAWVGLENRGTEIEIKVVEKVPPQVPTARGDLVASKPGIIQELIVIQGTPLVHEGETVRTGQVLIQAPADLTNPSAKPKTNTPSRPKPNQLIEVPAAKGFARGRVWYSAEAKVPLVEDKVEESGRLASGWGIKFGHRVIMLTTPESPYPEAAKEVKIYSLPSWRNWRFPVEVINVNFRELRQVHIERTSAEARQEAEALARAEIQGKITPGARIMEETVRVLSSTGGVERIRVEVETYEDLAVYPNP